MAISRIDLPCVTNKGGCNLTVKCCLEPVDNSALLVCILYIVFKFGSRFKPREK